MTQMESYNYKTPPVISKENGLRLLAYIVPLLELTYEELYRNNDLKGLFLKDENNPGLDKKLFIVFGKNQDINAFSHLEKHPEYFAQYDTTDDKYNILIFKLDSFEKELNIVLSCKLSTIPVSSKAKILKYNYGYLPFTNLYPKGIPDYERKFFPPTWNFVKLDEQRQKLIKELSQIIGVKEDKIEEYCAYQDPEIYTFKGIIYE